MGIMGAVLTAFYMFRLIFLTFFGEERIDPRAKEHLHESPSVMTVPLVLLACFSAVAGYVGLPVVLGEKANLFKRFLVPVIHAPHEAHLSLGVEWLLILISVAVALSGIYIAYVFYLKSPGTPHRIVARFPGLYNLVSNKYYVDEAYNAVFVDPTVKGSQAVYDHFDLRVIDGTINGTAAAAGFSGRVLSLLQSGLIKDYALILLLGVVVFVGYVLF
jgi:NADH-quinone oxidoreductase subunit L